MNQKLQEIANNSGMLKAAQGYMDYYPEDMYYLDAEPEMYQEQPKKKSGKSKVKKQQVSNEITPEQMMQYVNFLNYLQYNQGY